MTTLRRLPLETELDLESTLYSGQSFRWRPHPDGWHQGFVENLPVRIRTRGRWLEWDASGGVGPEALERYFRLDGSHERFLKEVQRDSPLDAALQAFPGLRLLRQDPWEMMVSYIVSANSNVGKISRTLEALALRAGPALDWGAGAVHGFPSPDELARLTEESLRATSMGYRAPYLRAAVRAVASRRVDPWNLVDASYEEAHEVLVEVPGVGDKVADCIQLYGMGHVGAFPVDVWITRVIREQYFPRRRMNQRRLGEWAREHFGPWAGYAQHYLFHYRRVRGPWAKPALIRIHNS